MARITQVSDTAATPEAGALFSAIKGKIGMVPNLYRIAANQPSVLAAMLGLNETLSGGAFDGRTREAIALAVAGANTCDYCASANSVGAVIEVVATGVPAGWGAPVYGKLDADLAAARAAGLSEADIVETLANVVANIFTNYLNHVADTDIDFPVVTTGQVAA